MSYLFLVVPDMHLQFIKSCKQFQVISLIGSNEQETWQLSLNQFFSALQLTFNNIFEVGNKGTNKMYNLGQVNVQLCKMYTQHLCNWSKENILYFLTLCTLIQWQSCYKYMQFI